MSDVRALLLTDVVDSTKLSEMLGDEASAALWAAHDRVARDLLRVWQGREIDKSDGMLLLFGAVSDAVAYSMLYHRAIAKLSPPLKARAGLHEGPVILRENSKADVARGAKPLEVDGMAKPTAARVMALAQGGQTLLTREAREALVETPFRLQSHGHWRIKGVSEPLELFEVGDVESPFTPPPDTEKAYRVVRVEALWCPLREVRHNLTPERDAFIGRSVELRALAARLDAGARLLTVLGTGGTGKTRLVRRYAKAWLGEWPGGVYFCDLSEARSLEGIHFAVALALGVPLGKEDAGIQLGHAIAGRGRCLVILDNFEQVQTHADTTVGKWLDRASQARFIITSRERLHTAGEEVFALEPMDLAADAMELFEVRAQAQQPGFLIDDGNRALVAQIVQLLDGLPLAVELAAARVRVLSPAQILERMMDRFALLAGARGVAERQATLRAAIDWSWELLAPWEQWALAQCSVFDGGFALEAAEAVLDLSAWTGAPPVIDAIHSLVDKSLLRVWLPKTAGRLDIGEPFFGMYLSIHDYASQKLHAFGEQVSNDAERRHGRYFASLGSDQALDALLAHGGVAKRQKLAMELDNLVTACRRAIQWQESDLAVGCFLAAWAVLGAQGPFNLAAALGRQVTALDGLVPHYGARVLVATAQALRDSGQIESADAMLAQALTIAQQSQDRRAEAMALRNLAVARHRQGNTDEALQYFATALAVHNVQDARAERGALLTHRANLEMELGRMSEARTSYEAALALHREIGNRAAEGIALGNRATLDHALGHVAAARDGYDTALLIHRETGNLLQEAITLSNLGILVSQQGDRQEAAAHYVAALKIHREIGNRRGEGVVLGQIGELHQTLGEFEQARVHYDEALRIHREVGNRRFEGGVLGSVGDLLAKQGQVEASLQALEAGERLLRQVDDPLDLAKLLCMKGSAALAGGDAEAARLALDEAEGISTQLGAEPTSDLGQQIEALRRALG